MQKIALAERTRRVFVEAIAEISHGTCAAYAFDKIGSANRSGNGFIRAWPNVQF